MDEMEQNTTKERMSKTWKNKWRTGSSNFCIHRPSLSQWKWTDDLITLVNKGSVWMSPLWEKVPVRLLALPSAPGAAVRGSAGHQRCPFPPQHCPSIPSWALWHLGYQNPRPINPLFPLQSNSVEDKELKLFMTYIPRLRSLLPTNLYKSPNGTVVWLKLRRWKRCESVWPWPLLPLLATEELHLIFFSPYFTIDFKKEPCSRRNVKSKWRKLDFLVLEKIKFSKAKVTLIKVLDNKWIKLSPQPLWKLKAHS